MLAIIFFFLDENRFAKGGYSILSTDIEIFRSQEGYLITSNNQGLGIASEIDQTLCIAKVHVIDSFIHARSDCILCIPFICSGSPN